MFLSICYKNISALFLLFVEYHYHKECKKMSQEKNQDSIFRNDLFRVIELGIFIVITSYKT